MAATINDPAVKRPFYVILDCPQLKDIDHQDHFFETGLLVQMVAAFDKRDAIKAGLELVSEILRINKRMFSEADINVRLIHEISAESAESFRYILAYARPQAVIDKWS